MRRYLIRTWDTWAVGFLLASVFVGDPVGAIAGLAAVLFLAFGVGVHQVAVVVADDVNAMRRRIHHLEQVNRRMVENARQRARRRRRADTAHMPDV